MYNTKQICLGQKTKIHLNNAQKSYLDYLFRITRLAKNYAVEQFNQTHDTRIFNDPYQLSEQFLEQNKNIIKDLTTFPIFIIQSVFLDMQIQIKELLKNTTVEKLRLYPKKDIHFPSLKFVPSHFQIVNKKDSKKDYVLIKGLKHPIKLSTKLRFKNSHIISITFKKRAGVYMLGMRIKLDEKDRKIIIKKYEKKNNHAIGIDLGIKETMTLSNGITIQYPCPYETNKNKISIINKKISAKRFVAIKNKTPRSNNIRKLELKLAKLSLHITNIRLNYIHKITTILVRHFDYIAMENLDVLELFQNRLISRKLGDVSFYETFRQLTYKSKLAGKIFYQVDRYFPSTKKCARCGQVKQSMPLSERIYYCENCHLIINRDHNAAINIKWRMIEDIGCLPSKFTLVDFHNLQLDLKKNNVYSKKLKQETDMSHLKSDNKFGRRCGLYKFGCLK